MFGGKLNGYEYVHHQTMCNETFEKVSDIIMFQKFQGAIHISQPFYIDKQDPENSLSYLTGPTLLIEWIDNGLLYDFVERVGDWGQSLPNRMLWRLFLCCEL